MAIIAWTSTPALCFTGKRRGGKAGHPMWTPLFSLLFKQGQLAAGRGDTEASGGGGGLF